MRNEIDSGIIFGVTLIDATMGFVQEAKGECDRCLSRIRYDGCKYPTGYAPHREIFLNEQPVGANTPEYSSRINDFNCWVRSIE